VYIFFVILLFTVYTLAGQECFFFVCDFAVRSLHTCGPRVLFLFVIFPSQFILV